MDEIDKTKRSSRRHRKSAETEIELCLNIDGTGKTAIHTGFGLFDHMLTLLAFWADVDLELNCSGDLNVDAHHTMEDCGLLLGQALKEALGERHGIARTASARVPMDEALAVVSLDLSGRPWLVWRNDELLPPVIAGEEKDVWREFYKAFASAGLFNLHIDFLYGKNGHHLLESAAKGCGVALRQACKQHDHIIRSTKGVLDL